MKKRILTYGTFDLFHHGHENILKSAKEFGDFLIVGLSTDNFNKLKGKEAYDSFEVRKKNLLNSGLVDEVIEENTWEQKIDDVINYDIDVFIMGSDWEGKFDFLKQHCQVYYPKRTEGISSTMLREKINK